MSHMERSGIRDLTYSAWHRYASTGRFVGHDKAKELAMIDIDAVCWVEYEDESDKIPILLIETAIDIGQTIKPVTITQRLAVMAGIPALCVLYTISNARNPANPEYYDISQFRVQRITVGFQKNESEAKAQVPVKSRWKIKSPQEYAEMLLRIREEGVDCILGEDF